MDRHQNNRMLRQYLSGIAQRPPHHTIAVPTTMQNSHNVRSPAVGKQFKQKKSSSLSLAQHHLPALDLFWASFFESSSPPSSWSSLDSAKYVVSLTVLISVQIKTPPHMQTPTHTHNNTQERHQKQAVANLLYSSLLKSVKSMSLFLSMKPTTLYVTSPA